MAPRKSLVSAIAAIATILAFVEITAGQSTAIIPEEDPFAEQDPYFTLPLNRNLRTIEDTGSDVFVQCVDFITRDGNTYVANTCDRQLNALFCIEGRTGIYGCDSSDIGEVRLAPGKGISSGSDLRGVGTILGLACVAPKFPDRRQGCIGG